MYIYIYKCSADFVNMGILLWYQFGGLCKNKGRPSSLEFLDCMHRNYLTQHVLEPTFKGNTLDLILTDDPARIFRVLSGPPLGSSEKDCLHSSLTWKYELRSKLRSKRGIKGYSPASLLEW